MTIDAARRHRAGRPGGALGAIGLVVAISCLIGTIVVTFAVIGSIWPGEAPPPRAVTSDSPSEPAPGTDAQVVAGQPDAVSAPPVDGQPLSISIPSLGLTANVGAMTVPKSGQVNPPTPGSGYWIRQYGLVGPASDNTAYIAGHTFRKGNAVFNPLFDIPNSAVTVGEGDVLVVTAPEGSYRYIVTKTALYDKVTLGEQTEMWERVPGRLALVTCFQYNGGTSSTQNFVVYAQLDAA